jgi:hypothetical protein
VVLALLLAAGTLIQACSDNNGSTGPRFECREQKGGVKVLSQCTGSPAPTTGFANTSAEIKVQVGINPNSITPGTRAGVTAFVTNLNGLPLAGKSVQFSTDVGSLDTTVVPTNAQGQASTYLRVSAQDVTNSGKSAATVTAFVDGAVGTGTVNFGGNPVPATLAISPTSIPLTEGPVAGTCSTGPFANPINAQFTISGGVPPYTGTTTGSIPGAALSGTGGYTAPTLGPKSSGFTVTDTVTVVDTAGASVTATVVISCKGP